MNLCLSEYTGSGARNNPFRPKVAGHSIDLRPDCSVRDGYALVSTEDSSGRSLKLGEWFRDTFGMRVRNRIHDRLGVDVSGVGRFDVLAATLMLRPNGWNPLRPAGDRFEIWLGGLVWEFPLVQGGASDNFNRANETPLAAPWATTGYGDQLSLVSNAAKSPSNSDHASLYTAAASGADQYSQCSLTTVTSGIGGPAVRAITTSGGNFYFIEAVSSSASEFGKIVTGSYSDLGAGGAVLANPVRITAAGSTIRAYKNSTTELPSSPKTDTSIATGQPAIFLYDTGGSADDWSGGDLVSAFQPRNPAVNFQDPGLF